MQDLDFINQVLRMHVARLYALWGTMQGCYNTGDIEGYNTARVMFSEELQMANIHAIENDVAIPHIAGNDYFH